MSNLLLYEKRQKAIVSWKFILTTNIQDGGQLNISSQNMSRNKADIKVL